MPIKFRCPHCQQFLGISRSKAGSVTDCPTCGRTIRVPELDGKVAPLPKPKLDYADSGLAKALNELASLGATDVQAREAGASSLPRPEVVIPASSPVVEAVPLPVPLPPDPMPHGGPSDPAAVPVSPARPITQSPESFWRAIDELAAIPPVSPRPPSVPKSSTPLLVVAIACLLAGLGAGFWIGRLSFGPSRSIEPPVSVAGPTSPPEAAEAPIKPVAEPSVVPPPAPSLAGSRKAVEGRVTFITSEGESRPDAGARVLVVPATREGTSKIAVDSFRAGSSEADLRLAQASIRAIGGDFVLVGEDGHFEIQLSNAGKYQIIIVSRHQGRNSDGQIDPAEIAVLKDWFDKPTLFFGQTLSTLAAVQFDGQNSSTRDHVFTKAE